MEECLEKAVARDLIERVWSVQEDLWKEKSEGKPIVCINIYTVDNVERFHLNLTQFLWENL